MIFCCLPLNIFNKTTSWLDAHMFNTLVWELRTGNSVDIEFGRVWIQSIKNKKTTADHFVQCANDSVNSSPSLLNIFFFIFRWAEFWAKGFHLFLGVHFSKYTSRKSNVAEEILCSFVFPAVNNQNILYWKTAYICLKSNTSDSINQTL